jgi:hypothetical protein
MYHRWLEPRTSVLDKYDRPLAPEIDAALSLEELVRRYEPLRQEVERVRAERKPRAVPGMPPGIPSSLDEFDQEPFKSERQLHEAITTWESRAREIRAVRFHWATGLGFAVIGFIAYRALNRWFGLSLVIVGFFQMVYWTSPEFTSVFLGGTREFDRLLTNKLVLSLASLVMLAIAVGVCEVFKEDPELV